MHKSLGGEAAGEKPIRLGREALGGPPPSPHDILSCRSGRGGGVRHPGSLWKRHRVSRGWGSGVTPWCWSRDWAPRQCGRGAVPSAGRGGPGPALECSVRGRADPWAPWVPHRVAQGRGCWYDGGMRAQAPASWTPAACQPGPSSLEHSALCPLPPLNLQFPIVWVCPFPPCPDWGCSEAGPGASSVPACPPV